MVRPKKTKQRGRPYKGGRDPLVAIRLTPAMKDALDEIALEQRTTRSSVMRQLIEHALDSPPKPTKALADSDEPKRRTRK